MPALTYRMGMLALATAVSCLLLSAGPAAANRGSGGRKPPAGNTDVSGNSDDGTISATAEGVVFDRSKNGSGPSAGAVTPVGNWSPPPCWLAPEYTPAQLQKTLEPVWEEDSTGYEWDNSQRNKYVKGHPYKDFNKAEAGKGYWWGAFVDRSYPPGWDSCYDKEYLWVDKGDPPPKVPNAVTPKVLAELAYKELRVPSTQVELSPGGATLVNLATWVWLDTAKFRPVSVTASVPVLGIQATTTATPVSLTLEPGTSDATTNPASGVCPIKNGRIGVPYSDDKVNETPPCGVTYLRSSVDGAYHLKATITWQIHWTGTGEKGQTLPDGRFGTVQDVVVKEAQAVNR
jgi:enoyl reductase